MTTCSTVQYTPWHMVNLPGISRWTKQTTSMSRQDFTKKKNKTNKKKNSRTKSKGEVTGTKTTSSVMSQNMFHLSMVLLCVKCPDQSQYCKIWDASRLIALDVHYHLQFSTIDNTWSGKPISWQRAINVTDQYDWTHPWLNGLVCLSIQSLCVLRSLSAGESG